MIIGYHWSGIARNPIGESRLPPQGVRLCRLTARSTENLIDHLAVNVGQAIAAPLEFVGQPLVVDP